jgi:hypothetical protein
MHVAQALRDHVAKENFGIPVVGAGPRHTPAGAAA